MWLHRELHPAGLPIVVVEARHMRVSLSTMRNKTDRNDARGIAQMMRLGWFRAVHVKNVDAQKMRTLLSNRKLLKRKLVDIENHVRGALRTYGLLVGPISRGRYEARIRELIEHTDIVVKTMIETMLEVRRGHFRGLRQAAQDRSAGCSARCSLPTSDDGSGCRTRCRVVIQGGRE
jgi:transposase